MSVVEDPDRLDLVHDDADAIGPEEGNGEDGEQPLNPLLCVGDGLNGEDGAKPPGPVTGNGYELEEARERLHSV